MERKCTNISSLFICCGFVILLFILFGYSATKSDIDRLTKGYDDCGNICGRKNKDLKINGCTYEDMMSKPKVEVTSRRFDENTTIHYYSCVENCKQGYQEVFNRCFKSESDSDSASSFFTEISEDLAKTWYKILLICFIAFILSYVMLLLFRYAIEYVIWIINCLHIAFFIIGAIVSFMYGIIALGITMSIGAVVSIFILFYFYKRIKLVAELFKETSKALVDVPTILFEPVFTFLSLLFAIMPYIYFTIVIETAGDPVNLRNPDGTKHVTFVGDGGIIFARFLNAVAFIWFTQFVLGCQHFVIAGTICKWYEARNKNKLDSPVYTTFSQLVRFHLGSICLGSMLITLVKILQMLNNYLKQHARESNNVYLKALACCFSCILDLIEEFLKYLLRNAYIIIAKDGTPLIQSGRKACNLLLDNLMDVVALNRFGDIVLVVARIFICAVTTLIAYLMLKGPEINNVWIPVALCGIFSFLIAHCFVTVFEMTVDTIFICFCDDLVENDGETRPYYMSPELRAIMEKLKSEAGGEFNFGNKNNGENLPVDDRTQGYNPTPQPFYPPTDGSQGYYPPPQNPQPIYPPADGTQGYYPVPQNPQPYYPAQPMYPPVQNPQNIYPNQPQGGYYPPA